MKTLLINLPHHNTPFPLGMAYVAGSLQHNVVGFDAFWWKLNLGKENEESGKIRTIEEMIQELILHEKPDIIGMTLHQFTGKDIFWTKKIREYHQGIMIAGGGSVSIPKQGKEILRSTELDIVVCGDGEHVIKEIEDVVANGDLSLLKSVRGIIYKLNGEIIQNPPSEVQYDIDCYIPDRSIFPGLKKDESSYKEITLYTARGCFWNCSYCSVTNIANNLGVKRRRTQSAKRVIEELDQVACVRKIDELNIFDDDFLGLNQSDYYRAAEIFKELEKYKDLKKVFFETTPRAIINSYNKCSELWELIHKFNNAGIEIIISIGIESMSPSLLLRMGKKTDCIMNLEAASIVRKYTSEKSTFTYIMYLDHKITLDELKESIMGFYDILALLPNAPHKDLLNKTLVPTPGSNTWYELKAEDRLIEYKLPIEIDGYSTLKTYYFCNDDVAKAYLLIEYFKNSLDVLYQKGIELKKIVNAVIDNAARLEIPASEIIPIGVFYDLNFKRGFMSRLKADCVTKEIQAMIKNAMV